MKRRTFLLAGLGASGALLLGWSVLPPAQRQRPEAALPRRAGRVVLNGWVAVDPDDHVTVFLPRVEMGQGAHTALAMILAEELDADFDRVRVEAAPDDPIYYNLTVGRDALPLPPGPDGAVRRVLEWYSDKTLRTRGMVTTGGSTSVRDCWHPLREAGATARATLVATAARMWDAPATACLVRDGAITHGARSITFGALLATGTPLVVARSVTLKEPAAFRLVGRSPRRLDARTKADGSATFGLDVRLDGMRIAALALPPRLGATVQTMNPAAARAAAGVDAVVPLTGRHGSPPGVAVVARSFPEAVAGVAALQVTWADGPHAAISSAGIRDALQAKAREPGGRVFRRIGNPGRALAETTADQRVVAEYDVPYLAHATLEPPNCTVLAGDGHADVWVGTQSDTLARQAVAEVLGVPVARVTLHSQYLGGGFGRRLEVDMIGQAAEVARAMPGVPVQVRWSRTDDLRHDLYRPAMAARLEGALTPDGMVRALQATVASQEVMQAYGARAGARLTRFDVRKHAVEGLFDQPYRVEALRVAHQRATFPVPVGFWRSVGHSGNAFFLESFVDELAHAAEADPVAFRRRLLEGGGRAQQRARAVLDRAALESGWGEPAPRAPDGAPIARGVALHESFGSVVVQVAEVSLAASGAIRVHRVTCAVDCGLAIHPDGIAQQMESGVVFGLTAALFGEVRIEGGRVLPSNLDGYRLLRMAEVPRVVTHVVESAEPPQGIGEVATPPIAPAVANALFALTGQRLRSLPFRRAGMA
jgi:isoquinoline 1-oxidoreductase beta subunit